MTNKKAGVGLGGCEKTCAIINDITAAKDDDWGMEFLDLILAVKVVRGLDEAMDHITVYGSQHTDSIVTSSYPNSQRFLKEVDASAVMVNASTRFSVGGQFGLGAEIGISTTKLHAYGPMGLKELTTQKFIVFGEGHLRRVLRKYFAYYNRCRVHQSLEMDAPEGRRNQAPDEGRVIAIPHIGGLHHHYERRAA